MSMTALSNTLLMDYLCIAIQKKITTPFVSLRVISIHQGLCRKVDVERAFGVSEDTVGRAYKKFLEKGEAGFFRDDARKANRAQDHRRTQAKDTIQA